MRSTILTAMVVALSASAAMAVSGEQTRPNPSAARKAPGPALAPVAVDTDLACSLSIDGENQGELAANGSKTFELPPGEHVLRAVSKDDPSIVWRQIVDVAGQRKAVLIELAPLLERKRAAEADKVRAEQQVRAEAEHKAAEAETARLEQLRLAEQARREKAAEEQRAAEAERVRREAERVETEKATVLDAARARSDDEKRFSTALLLHGWKQPLPFNVSAATEGGQPVLRISGPEARARLALVERQGKPAFRFEVQHIHGRECTGFLYITRTNIAYDPIQPQFKQDGLDIPRTSIQKLKVDGDSPKVDFESAGHDYRFVFLVEEIGAPKKASGVRFLTAPKKSSGKARAMSLTQGFLVSATAAQAPLADTGLRMSIGATGVAMREWFKAVMLDFDAAQKAFERQTADLKLQKR